MEVREGAFLLRERGEGQHEVGVLRGRPSPGAEVDVELGLLAEGAVLIRQGVAQHQDDPVVAGHVVQAGPPVVAADPPGPDQLGSLAVGRQLPAARAGRSTAAGETGGTA